MSGKKSNKKVIVGQTQMTNLALVIKGVQLSMDCCSATRSWTISGSRRCCCRCCRPKIFNISCLQNTENKEDEMSGKLINTNFAFLPLSPYHDRVHLSFQLLRCFAHCLSKVTLNKSQLLSKFPLGILVASSTATQNQFSTNEIDFSIRAYLEDWRGWKDRLTCVGGPLNDR